MAEHNRAEYIEREVAQKVICGSCLYNEACDNRTKDNCFVSIALKSIPAADVVERKKGKWRLHDDGSATCSVCGFFQTCVWDWDNWDNFCHHCGADMRDG